MLTLNVRDLEKAVEDLSELLESPVEAETIPTLRQKVTDKTVCLDYSYSVHLSLIDEIFRYTYRNETRLCWRILLKVSWTGGGNGMWMWMGLRESWLTIRSD
jgi:hypothetical protein